MLSFGLNTSFSISSSETLANAAYRFGDVYCLIFFSSCGDGLEGEDKCRFDFWVCGG
jgi:hypothetical protein